MASSSNLVITKIDVFRVAPSSNSPESDSKEQLKLPLTFFDMFWLRSQPVERISIYKLTQSTPSFFNSVIIPSLKRSLSLTLPHFLPVAGNLVWPPHSTVPIILYTPNESSVSVTIAESNADFNRLSANGPPRQAAESYPYIPELEVSESKASILSLQITNFPNQGFCIGMSFHHAIQDGKSMSLFIAAWVHICRQLMAAPQLLPELAPPLPSFYDRTTLLQAESAVLLLNKKWAKVDPKTPRSLSLLPLMRPISPEDSMLSRFHLSGQDITRLKEKVMRILGLQYVSTFVVAVGYTLFSWLKAKQARDKPVLIAFSADCRSRLNPPLPPNYFGNCLDPRISQISVRELIDVCVEHDHDHGVALVANKIRDAIRGLDDHHEEDYKSVDQKAIEICEKMVGGDDNDDEGLRRGRDRQALIFMVSGSPRFGYYDADFGWGKPVRVELTSIARNGAIFLSDGRDGGGSVEVGLVLNKQEMEAFQHLFATRLKSLSNSEF